MIIHRSEKEIQCKAKKQTNDENPVFSTKENTYRTQSIFCRIFKKLFKYHPTFAILYLRSQINPCLVHLKYSQGNPGGKQQQPPSSSSGFLCPIWNKARYVFRNPGYASMKIWLLIDHDGEHSRLIQC